MLVKQKHSVCIIVLKDSGHGKRTKKQDGVKPIHGAKIQTPHTAVANKP